MSTTPNTPLGTPARPGAVSRALAVAGFERAESEATSVRGYRRYSPGFQVRGAKAAWEVGLVDEADAPVVVVTHETLDSFDYDRTGPRRPAREVVAEMAEKYRAALDAAGFQTAVRECRGTVVVEVTGRRA